MNQEQKIQIRDEDEINLMDYVKVILKRKWLIFSVFLLAVIAAGIFSFASPKIYEIDTIFEIGRKGDVIIEEADQMVEKIKGDVYGIFVREKLGIPIQEYPEIKAENLAGTMLIRMIIESPDSQKAKNILREINKIILAEHQEKIKTGRELIGKNIETAEGKIKLTERDIEKARDKIKLINSDIEKTRNKIKPLEDDIKRIESKIIFSEKEKENLEEQVRALEKVLIFEQTPGTQFALFNARRELANKGREIEDLYSRINSLRIQIENLNLTINSLERTKKDYGSHIISLEVNIENLNAHINSLKASLDDISPTEIVRIPIASTAPIRPRPLLNIAIAGILGLFMGTFLAFGREWYAKSK